MVGNIKALQKNGCVTLCGVAIFLADDPLQFAEFHAIRIGYFDFGVDLVAFFERRPQPLVPHDHGVDNSIAVERKLILAQHAEFFWMDDISLLRVQLTGKKLHESGFTGAVWPGQTIALARRKTGGYFVKQNFGAVAHRHIAD